MTAPTAPTTSPRARQAAAGVLAGLALGVLAALFDGVLALLGPTALGVLVLAVLVRGMASDVADQRRLLRWTMFGFLAHLALGLFLNSVSGPLTRYVLAPDAGTYDRVAKYLVTYWESGGPAPRLAPGKEGFYYLLGGIYWLLGPHAVAGLAVNATFAAAIVPVVTDTTRRLYGPSAARYVAPLAVLLPGCLLWWSQLLKEAGIGLLVAVAANCAIRLTERASLASLVGVAASLAVLFTFRAWVALVIAAGLVLGMALGKGRLLSGLGAGLGGASLLAVLVALGLGYSGYRAAVNADLKEADVVRKELATTAGSGFDADADVSTPLAAVSYLPRGLFNFVLGPFPWQIRSARQLAVVPEMVIWWWLLPSLWAGLRAGRRLVRRRSLVLLMPAVATSLLLSLSIGNFGTVLRERQQVVVLLLPLIALGLSVRRPAIASGNTPRGPFYATATAVTARDDRG
ncbi:MAG TPA: hypothetical protein VHF24_06585 [Acidimicrobiales bacterium]|nr:hypothetical protein [Acidimicrobiales bacterium]